MFARRLHGRILFEEIMRENLDIGRPDHVQLIFGWRIARRTPSRFGTRTITVRVQLSLHMDDQVRASSRTSRKDMPCERRR